MKQSHSQESALGNLFADLLLHESPGADVALLNGGGLRAPLPPGELTYGRLYESQPFDNRVARLSMTGAQLRTVVRAHLERPRHGIISISGARVEARCKGKALDVSIVRDNGKPIGAAERLIVVTSDYLATGGDELYFVANLAEDAITVDKETLRDALADALRKRKGTLDGDDPNLLDPKHPRLLLPGSRPVTCGKAAP